MNEDRASTSFIPDHNDAKTVKDLLRELVAGQFSIWVANTTYAVGDFVRATTTNGKVFKCTAIAGDEKSGASEPTWDTEVGNTTVDDQVTWTCRGGEMTSYSHVKSYTATFDDTTGIIDTFAPKDSFRVYLNDSRLSKIKGLMRHVGYKCRVEDDEEIHFFIPVTSGSSYDEEYNDAVTGHNFFEKGVRKRVVIPGYFVVSSHPDHLSPFAGFTGFAKDSGYDALPTDLQKRIFKYFRVTSNAQCTSIAGNLLIHKQIDAEKGHGFAPMNCLQEVFDHVLITDSKVGTSGDTRAGTIGYINRKYLASGRPEDFSMQFRFGSIAPGQYLGTMPPAETGISTAALAIGQMSLWDAVNAIFSGDPEIGWPGLNTLLPGFEDSIQEAKDEIIQIEPDAGIPAGGADGAINWRSIFDGSTDTPTSVAWALETGLPFTPTGRIYFSPIIEEVPNVYVVYVIDEAQNFWKYNITEKNWYELTSPTYSGASNGGLRNLVPSPNGTKLACISESTEDHRGGKRIEIYTISSNSWSASGQVQNMDDETPASQATAISGLAWKDETTIYVWAHQATAGTLNYARCIKYTVGGAFTISATLLNGSLTYAEARNAAINAAGTIIYGSAIGATVREWQKYTIDGDSYATGGTLTSGRAFAGATDYGQDKLWYVTTADYRPGYLDTADDSENDNQFAENTDRTASFGIFFGVDNAVTYCLAHAKSTTPRLMSVIAGGTYLLATLHASGWTPVTIEKPDDTYAVLVINTADNVTLAFDHSVQTTLWDGTWKFYYPQTGDYTQVKIKVGIS